MSEPKDTIRFGNLRETLTRYGVGEAEFSYQWEDQQDPTCKTCRWWGNERHQRKDERACVSPKLYRTGNDRVADGVEIDDEQHVLCSGEAAVTDGSGFVAVLWTTPDFGCVNHEPIERVRP